jgi:hypothetical protein
MQNRAGISSWQSREGMLMQILGDWMVVYKIFNVIVEQFL